MPLPAQDTDWPPRHLQPMYSKMAEWAAWYSGEPSRIIDAYASQTAVSGPVPWWRFWSRARAGLDGAQRALLHVPIASDLAATSGALLFGESPHVRIREQTKADTGRTQLEKAEARLLQVMEEGYFFERLVEAAESAAAIGGVYIYPVWDKDLRDFPIMGIAQSDMAVPEFRHGILSRVTFHRVVESPGNQDKIMRHIEVHEVEGTGTTRKAVVLNALFAGNEGRLGIEVSLGVSGATAGLEPRIELPFSELDVEYVPNIKPNRLWRASSLGVSDYQGSETLLDALDETYASWMRDVRLAKARIIVPREYLRPDANKQPSFDIDQEIYVAMDMEPGLSQDARSMLATQFEIRYLEHRETAKDLVERIVSNAGYAATTLAANEQSNRTGTALRITEHKTLLTLRRKSGWWRTAVANTLQRMMAIDREVFKNPGQDVRPTVVLSDSIIDNPLELAQTALALKSAEAASAETRVRMVHPDWSEAEVAAEAEAILAQTPVPSTTVGFGRPGEDPASTSKVPTTPPEGNPKPSAARP